MNPYRENFEPEKKIISIPTKRKIDYDNFFKKLFTYLFYIFCYLFFGFFVYISNGIKVKL